ncbi:MAG: excisionase [Lachnospiraceae bacterium]|nr:hypothetical protein [Lachnospiraceae bacterium]MDY2956333.1 excisionase [Lachnospiraceae bacterium]
MENLINVVNGLMMEDAALWDYLDEEGILCCGNCHTRKQAMNEKPIILGDRKIREIVEDDSGADYLIRVGNRVMIKRKRFEQFLDRQEAV